MKIEKKIYNYKEICENFLRVESLTQNEYKDTILSLVEHVRNKHNLQDVVVTFNLDGDDNTSGVAHAGSSVQFKQEMLKKDLEKPTKLFDSYITIIHEFAHVMDWRQNETKDNAEKREFISFKAKALLELAKYKPEKKEFYETLAFAIYYTGRSEVFARQVALKESQQLIDDLVNLAQTEHKVDEYFVNLKKSEHEEEFAKLDEKTNFDVLANKYARNFGMYKEYLEHNEDLNLDNYRNIQMIDTYEAKKDFVEVANDILDTNNLNLQIIEQDKQKLAEILQIPGFYDDKLAHNFYDYFEKTKAYNSCKFITKIEDFKLSEKQIKILENGLKTQNNILDNDFVQ